MTDATELWREISGYEGRYEVSDQGRVRSLDRTVVSGEHARRRKGKIISAHPNNHGYLCVNLFDSTGRRRSRKVHRLVSEAFLGPRPEGMEVCHSNGDKADNRAVNLRYGTHVENMLDVVRHGTHNHASRTHCPAGHPYAGDNLREHNGKRYCRACSRERCAARRRKLRTAAARAAQVERGVR